MSHATFFQARYKKQELNTDRKSRNIMEEGKFLPSQPSKPILDDINEIVRLVREQPPEHCIMKVDSFSVLQDALSKASKDHIDSTEFTAGGYTWVMSIYPKGNKQAGATSHLSVYVKMVDKLSFGSFVNVSLRFFMYDQIRDNYLVVTDIRDKRFNPLKKSWGIPKLLPIDSFTDASNGFLVDDCCVFGIEVLVRGGEVKGSIVSNLTAKFNQSYTWRIEKFSNLNDLSYSPEFSFGEWSWKMKLYPRGVETAKNYISLFLHLANAKDLIHGSQLYIQYCFCLKNQGTGEDRKEPASTWFSSGSHDWGFRQFLLISDLHDKSKGFLLKDALILEVNIELLLMHKLMEKSVK